MNRESISIKKTDKGIWMKKFDDFEKSFTRISKKEAIESIKNARKRGDLFYESKTASMDYYAYYN